MYARFGSLYLGLYLAQRRGALADTADGDVDESPLQSSDIHVLRMAGWLGLAAVMLVAIVALLVL